jgi:threonine synthase
MMVTGESWALVCQLCGAAAGSDERCAACGGVVATRYALPPASAWATAVGWPGIWRYAPLLPVAQPAQALTLGEGNTPLVRSERLAAALGLRELWFKYEAVNPTGSYKDRIAAVALTRARERGLAGWLATSSGNAGAALAAYGARSGIPGTVVVPANAAPAKLAQIRAYGPRLVPVEGFGASADIDEAVFATLRAVAAEQSLALTITAHAFDPYALDGAKTIAFEIVEALAEPPDRVYVPAGGGGLATAVARGFTEWHEIGRAPVVPRLAVVQAAGCAPIVRAWEQGTPLVPVEAVTTEISGVQLAAPPDGSALLVAIARTNGTACAVEDAAVYAAQARLATEEGLLVEPAGALSLAGLIADVAVGRVAPDERIVCVLTGSGFKDRAALARLAEQHAPEPPVSVAALAAALAG